MSRIEWTQKTWNPIVGCSVVSPGCTNCYAMRQAARIERMGGAPHYAGMTQPSKAGPVWTGKVALAPDAVLLAPLKRRKPTIWFVNSMGDLFHESVPDDWIDRVFAIMALAPQHTFQVLTKRATRMRAYLASRDGMGNAAICAAINAIPAALGNRRGALEMPLPNVWLGVSAEDQRRADERVPVLLETAAAVRLVSAEPLLGPIDFTRIDPLIFAAKANALSGVWQWDRGPSRSETPRLDWIIVGGESGPKARPMHPDWARSIRDQCAAAGVPFFFKQWGAWAPLCAMSEASVDRCYTAASDDHPDLRRRCKVRQLVLHNDGRRFDLDEWSRFPVEAPGTIRAFEQGYGAMTMMAIGKRAAGRLLDGALHDAMPEAPR